jgi:hypothetical protein
MSTSLEKLATDKGTNSVLDKMQATNSKAFNFFILQPSLVKIID